MSRDLPANPNLEHLRKQAKRLLDDLRPRLPNARLADAQHAIAREYGFDHWAALRAHVESRPHAPAPASGESASPSASTAGAMAAVLREAASGLTGQAMSEAIERYRALTEARSARPPEPPGAGPAAGSSDGGMFARYTEAARRALFYSRYEAVQRGCPTIEPEHLLLGLVRESAGPVARLFARFEVTLDSITTQIDRRAAGSVPVPARSEEPLTKETKRALRFAAEEADGLLHAHIGPEHLLLGLLRMATSVPATVLRDEGLTLTVARNELR